MMRINLENKPHTIFGDKLTDVIFLISNNNYTARSGVNNMTDPYDSICLIVKPQWSPTNYSPELLTIHRINIYPQIGMYKVLLTFQNLLPVVFDNYWMSQTLYYYEGSLMECASLKSVKTLTKDTTRTWVLSSLTKPHNKYTERSNKGLFQYQMWG